MMYLMLVFIGYGESNVNCLVIPNNDFNNEKEIVDRIAEKNFTIVLKRDGTVWGWGKNEHGELGIGATSEQIHSQIQTTSGLLDHVININYDGATVVATRDDGSVWKSSDEKKQILFSRDGASSELRVQQGKTTNHDKGDENWDVSWNNKMLQEMENGVMPSATSGKSSSLMMTSAPLNQTASNEPQEPFLLSLTASGPYRDPANIELVAHVTPCDKATRVVFCCNGKIFNNNTMVLTQIQQPPYECNVTQCLGGSLPEGHYRFEAVAYDQDGKSASTALEVNILPSNRYDRGCSIFYSYLSSIIALDFEEGVFLDLRSPYTRQFYSPNGIDPNNNFALRYPQGYPWFLRTAADPNANKEPCYHLRVTETQGDKEQFDVVAVNEVPMLHGMVTGDAPPMVAFGKAGGRKKLFVGQSYRFGINAGGQAANFFPRNFSNDKDIKIEVYDKESFLRGAINVAPILTKTISLPTTNNVDEWNKFNNEGFIKEFHIFEPCGDKTIDFNTQIQYLPELGTWGIDTTYSLILTHRAGNDCFYYKVSVMGVTQSRPPASTVFFMACNQASDPAYNLSYTLDFENPPSWGATFINEPHFQTIPLPSSYQGKSVDELLHQTKPVSDALPNPFIFLLLYHYNLEKLDNSPELKSHPELDQLVEDYGKDPMALANYVLNEIELTDAIGYNVTGNVNDTSINPQGVSRDALGTYLEGQGSPAEQCALLIYLLRKAGYPAAYAFPEHNQMLMFDEQLSKLLQMQIRGATTAIGSPADKIPELIPVNYPWVVAYIDGKWVHLFPWLKDTSITEGKDIWNYFPDGYQNGLQWLTHYLLNDPELRSLSKKDNLGTLFKIYAQNKLAEAGLSFDDVGMKIFNHRHYYATWEEFPRPWQTPLISIKNIAQNLDVNQNAPELTSALQYIFDLIWIGVFSDREGKSTRHPGSSILRDPVEGDPTISTGWLRLADLHNRRLLLRHKQQLEFIYERDYSSPGAFRASENKIKYSNEGFKMILSLEAYDSSSDSRDTATTYSFNDGKNPDPGNLRSRQETSVDLYTTNDEYNDNVLWFQLLHYRHIQVQAIESHQNLKAYPNQFPGVGEVTTIEDCRPLFKGDMAVLNLNYGRVTSKMQQFEAQKYWNYQQYVATHPQDPINPELATGQLLQIMGQSYYYKLTQFRDFLQPLLKVHCTTTIAHGLTKLSSVRNSDGTIMLIKNALGVPDLKLAYPNVDMSFQDVAFVNPCSIHSDSGDVDLRYLDAMQLAVGDGSANEHQIINEFFGQDAAISTVRLLDIAQGWTPETAKASHPGSGIVRLTKENYLYEGAQGYNATAYGQFKNQSLAQWNASFWGTVENIFGDSKYYPDFSAAFITPMPVTAVGQRGQPFTGVGAMVLGMGNYGAYISGNMILTHGGSGGAVNYDIPQNDPPPAWVSGGSLNLTDDGAVYNNVAANVVNDGNVNYYDNSGTFNNFDVANNQVVSGNVQLDPQEQENLNFYQQIVSGGGQKGNPQPVSSSGEEAAALLEDQANRGDTGNTSFYSSIGSYCSNFVYDPVSVVTGEFYINALDLKLNGPMPLEIRRSYSSQNQANNNFGYGWKLSYFPYLMLSSDSDTMPSLIYAAEMDGSVIAYRRQGEESSTTWIPNAADNPNLTNMADGSPGASKNLFNNRITQQKEGDVIIYTLAGVDGSIRTFKTLSFPVVGSDSLNRTRPYLQSWKDSQGNNYTFNFSNDKTTPDYGQLVVISSSNGNSIHFHYDTKGHIIQAFTHDGRILKYEYSAQGDLIKVTLPDASIITYDYEKTPNPSGKGSYSTHLIVKETTPGGRILKNSYDSQRRVLTQAATVGTSPTPTLSATFRYDNNANADKTLTGTTKVTDVNKNITTYTYANSQTTSITYPQNDNGSAPTITQEWCSDGGYPRSLKKRTDRRGLVTEYQYDTAGNLTSRSITGDLTGKGGSDTATTTFSYNNSNFLTSITDPVGRVATYFYNDSQHPYSPTSILTSSGGKTIGSIEIQYTNVGGAYGLVSSITKDKSVTSYGYDAHGFLASQTITTGTEDPSVTTNYRSNQRGEIVSETDSIGRTKKYSYDALGRGTGIEIYDAKNELIDWHFSYYNGNGDIIWEQGAHFNPVDYLYNDYDRAGHLIHQLSWLAQAASDGSSVTSAGAAETSYTYDGQGNLISITDPNGHITSRSYDALGEMTKRSSGNGLAEEAFSYNPGGDIIRYTTPLNGEETFTYTSLGQIKSVTHADGTTASYHYDLDRRLTEETLANGSSWKTNYEDAERRVTRTFCDAKGAVLATESQAYDARGNVVEDKDRNNNIWTMTYDGLNRLKTKQGPTGETTQQSIHYTYPRPDCITTLNEAGESSNNFTDALGRVIQATIFNADGSIAKSISNQYSLDHYNVTTTTGIGNNAIVTTISYDTTGHPILIKWADGSCQLNSYDTCGNKTSFRDEQGKVTSYTYDALNHLASETLPGGGVIKYTYNPLGELLLREMPQNITEQNEYNIAGQKIKSSLLGSDHKETLNYQYQYEQGLLKSINDPRGFITSIEYDAWQHPISRTSSGSSIPEQNQTTTYVYNLDGQVTSVDQHYNDGSTGPSTLVSRDYNAYRELISETISLNGKAIVSWQQTWDQAGRRTGLNWKLKEGKGAQYQFSYNALGLPTSVSNITGVCKYTYGNQGLLFSKTTPTTTETVTRDKRGRVINLNLQNDLGIILGEHLDWNYNNKLKNYNILNNRLGITMESRSYGYDLRDRLIKEPYCLKNSINQMLHDGTTIVNYDFDQEPLVTGSSNLNGIGARTDAYIGTQAVNEVIHQDSFQRLIENSILKNDGSIEEINTQYDEAGNVLNQGSQNFIWDSFGRLVEINKNNSIWKTIYDGLGRRIQTESQSNIVNYYYDPEVEFLELGHSINGNHTWNLYGLDRSGSYGGAQGIGGLEAAYIENTGFIYNTVNNYFGDTVGIVAPTYHNPAPYSGIVGGYGPMPGSDVNHDLKPQWRGHYIDDTGLYYMGARYYDPQSGRFISPDPLGHSSSLSLYDYCNGDPVNGLDPDGRCVEKGKQEFAEGYDKSFYANGANVKYDNSIQQFGGFIEKSLSKAQPVIGTDPGTIAVGLQFNAAAGLQFNVSAQGSISNWADPATRRIGAVISITPLTGVSTAIGISGGVLTTKSNVNAPEKLNGWTGNGGGSITTAPFVNGYDEGNWGSKPMNSLFNGIGWSPSFGIPVLPVEAHTSATWTKSWSWNF